MSEIFHWDSLDSLERVFSPVMVRREKRRRPKTLTVEVIGSQVGVKGSPVTVCILRSHKDRAKVIQLQCCWQLNATHDLVRLLHSAVQHRNMKEGKISPVQLQRWSFNGTAFALPLIMAFDRYDNSGPPCYRKACGHGNHGGKQYELVGIYQPITMNLVSSS